MGAAIARYLAGMGATVALVDIKMPQAEENAATIIAEGGKARAYHVDMADEQAVINLVATVRSDFGSVDILVNNAGCQDRNYLENTTTEFWDQDRKSVEEGKSVSVRVDRGGSRIIKK